MPARDHGNLVSYFTTGDPGKEHRTYKPPPTRRIQERSKGDTTYPATSQNPQWHPSWLSNACTTRRDPESEWLARDNLETHSVSIKPEPHGQAVLLGSLTLLFYAQAPLPKKVSWFVSSCVSLDNSFLSVRQEPTLRPWKGSLFIVTLAKAPFLNAFRQLRARYKVLPGLTRSPLPSAPHAKMAYFRVR